MKNASTGKVIGRIPKSTQEQNPRQSSTRAERKIPNATTLAAMAEAEEIIKRRQERFRGE